MESNDNLISGFCREVDENCALLGRYAANSGNSLPTFRDNLSVLSSRVDNPVFGFLTLEVGTDGLSRNVRKDYRIFVNSRRIHKGFGLLTLEDGPIGCHEPSVRNYHYSLHNDPEERSYQSKNLLRR